MNGRDSEIVRFGRNRTLVVIHRFDKEEDHMFDVFCLSVVLAVGQGSPTDPATPPELPRHISVPNVAGEAPPTAVAQATKKTDPAVKPAQAVLNPLDAKPMPPVIDTGKPGFADQVPMRIPAKLPTVTLPPAPTPMPGRVPTLPVNQNNGTVTTVPVAPAAPAAPITTNGNGNGNGNGGACATCEQPAEEEKKEEEKGHFMKFVEGTFIGQVLDDHKLSINGWTAMSYTASTRPTTNLPVTWNDRANRFLLQQHWINVERALDTDSKEFGWGFKVAFLAGTDYRFTVIRGLFDQQLRNGNLNGSEINGFQQNLYGVDLPLFYANFWLPNLFEGTELTVGRMFCQFGYESVMAPTTPLMSRSYAFNWAPPFFHTGVMLSPKFNKNWSAKLMAVNGNDVFFDGSQEWRFAGGVTYTTDSGDDAVTLSTSFGRGVFNAGNPTPAIQTTTGLAWEPAGRNNMNVFDLLWTHKVCDSLSYALEVIYGYQRNVPAAATGSAANFGGGTGTAHWASVVQYLTYTISDNLTSILRVEAFDDFQGQRTGVEGLYGAVTWGVQWKIRDSIILRPEVRVDHNFHNPAFSGNRSIFTAGSDLIIKW